MTSTMATSSPPGPWSFTTPGEPKIIFPPLYHLPLFRYTLTPLVYISQGDFAQPRDLPRTFEIQARALPRSHVTPTAPRSWVRFWPPQMPGPSSRIGDGMDIDSEHARCVQIPSRSRRRRPPFSTRARVHHAGRFVSFPPADCSLPSPPPRPGCLLLVALTKVVLAPVALRADFSVARSRSNARSDRVRRPRGKRF
jgi:hypothetical protein